MTNADPNAPINIPVGFQFTPQSGSNALPDYGASRTPNPYLQSGYSEQIGPVRTTVIPLKAKGNTVSGLYYYRIERFNGQGGYRQLGLDKDYHASRSSGSLDTRFKDQGVLPQLLVSGQTVSVTINEWTVHSTNVFGLLAMGIRKASGGAESYILRETTATNSAIVECGYFKGANHDISGLTPLRFGGVDLLAVQFGDHLTPVELLSDLGTSGGGYAPTSAGNMNNTTKGTWGIVTGPDPTAYAIILGTGFSAGATSSISVMPPTAAKTDASTQTISGLPVGGYAVDHKMLAVGGPPLRAYFNLPPLGGSAGVGLQPGGNSSASANANDYQGEIVSVNARGFDLEQYGRSQMPLNNVVLSSGFRDGLLGSDTDRLIFSNLIRAPKDLRLSRDRVANSDRYRKIVGWWTKNNYDLYVLEEEVKSTSGASANSKFQIQFYDFDQDEWTPVSIIETEGAVGLQCFNPTGAMPSSDSTGYLHMLSGQNPWNLYRQFQPPPATNPYQYRQSTGATSNTGVQFDTAATDVSSLMTIDRLPGAILEPHRAYWGGQGDEGVVSLTVSGNGDSGSTVSLPAVTFTSPINAASRYRQLAPTRLQNHQLTISVTQGANTYKTPQVYPVAVEGIAYMDQSVYDQWSENGMISWG